MAKTIVVEPIQPGTKIPISLVRETLHGKPLYYNGYKNVLNGLEQTAAIVGISSSQSLLHSAISFHIGSKMDRKKYLLATGPWLQRNNKNKLCSDLCIFSKQKVTPNDKYFQVAPELAVEVDVKIETDKELDYIFAKSEEMKAFGCQKVLWIITKHKKIFVFAQGTETVIYEWDRDIELMKGISGKPIVLNLTKLLEEEGL